MFESQGEGIAVYVSQNVGVPIGGSSTKRLSLKIPKNKPRGFEVDYSVLAVGVEIPPTLAIPLRWRLELDGVAISRELKPQFTSQLEETLYSRSLFDIKPLVSQGRRAETSHAVLKASFDAAHPIVLRDVSFFSVYRKPGSKQAYSATYYSGVLVIEPGSKLSFSSSCSNLESSQATAYVALLLPSPLSKVSLTSSVTSVVVEGAGYKVVEIPVSARGDAIAIEYHQSEIKFYPRKAVIADALFVCNKLDTPKLSVRLESLELSGSVLNLKLSLENPDERSVDDVVLSVRHGVMNVKEIRLSRVEGKSITPISLPVDLSKISVKPQRMIIKVEWVYDGILSNSFLEVKL